VINPLIRPEPSGFNHFLNVHQLATKTLVHELVGNFSYSNHNSTPSYKSEEDNAILLSVRYAYSEIQKVQYGKRGIK
jgi:hypothetical protein